MRYGSVPFKEFFRPQAEIALIGAWFSTFQNKAITIAGKKLGQTEPSAPIWFRFLFWPVHFDTKNTKIFITKLVKSDSYPCNQTLNPSPEVKPKHSSMSFQI